MQTTGPSWGQAFRSRPVVGGRHSATPATILDRGDPPGVSLGSFPVAELVGILVGHHLFDASEGTRAVQCGLLLAGYPKDTRVIPAADAFDIVDSILRGAWWSEACP